MQVDSNKSFTVNGIAGGCSQRSEYGHILTFRRSQEWIERCCAMTSGNALNSYCRARPAIQAVQRRTTVCSSRRSSGFCAQAVHGVTCPESLGNGTAHTCALPVGVTAAFGSGWPTCWVAMRTWNTCSSIPPSSVPTSIQPAPKKSRQPGNRPLARRTDDQTACRRRRAGQSAACHSLGRTDRRHRPCFGIDRESAGPSRGGRQGLRRQSFCRQDRSIGCRSCDSAPVQSPHAARLRSASLPCSQFDRALLRTSQAFQTHRHALRQARQVLPVVHSSRMRFRLAGLIVNRP